MKGSIMDEPNAHQGQPPARMLAGALSHLARHMETGCPRASHLAAMLLEQVAADATADTHLRQHARELVEILERDPVNAPFHDAAPAPASQHGQTRRYVA
jgi:hypothetical protein